MNDVGREPEAEALRTWFGTLPEDLSISARLSARWRVDRDALFVDGVAFPFHDCDELIVVAVGKAGATLFDHVAPGIGAASDGGDGPRWRSVRSVVVAPARPEQLKPTAFFRGGHPVPNAASLEAARAVTSLLESATERSWVLFLLSGGGSAMLEAPLDPTIDLAEVVELYDRLVGSGATIEAINLVRRHVSAVKGGRLARAAEPARQLTLYVSDVPPETPEAIASGPTFPDRSTWEQAREVVETLGGVEALPPGYRPLFEQPPTSSVVGPESPCFERASFHKLLDNADAVAAVEAFCAQQGWVPARLELPEGTALDSAIEAHLRTLDLLAGEHPRSTVAVVSGGEIDVAVEGRRGTGGRNQSLALAMAERIEGRPCLFAAFATDGVDGNSSRAGAVVDGDTVARARALGRSVPDALARHDATPLLDALGAAIDTGPTGNNLRDVRVLVRAAR